ncbi:MAG: glycosyltransferase family 4 protein [Methanomassiliicoccales archaeon]
MGVFLGKLLNKRSVIVAGGYDVANEPSIDYGILARRWMRFVPKLAFNNCDKILAVSDFIADETKKIINDPSKIMVINNGIDTSRFVNKSLVRKGSVTIGNVTPRSLRVKGIDAFINIAGQANDQEFTLIGRTDLGVDVKGSSNLHLLGYRSGDDLVNDLNGHEFYLQLSYREGFGIAVAEAMACGCIPIVTDRGGLPEVVGDTGHIVPYGDWDKVLEMIRKGYDPRMGQAARERVERLFDDKIREVELVKVIEELFS